MLFTALAPPFLPLVLAAGAVISVFLLPWLLARPRLALLALFASLLVGQLVRLPLPGQAGGLLVSDLATVIVLIVAAIQTLFILLVRGKRADSSPDKGRQGGVFLLLLTPFLLWSLWTNIIHWSPTPTENLIALAYWGRLAATLLLLPALLFLFQSPKLRYFSHKAFLYTILALTIIGLLQWYFLPDLSFLARYGWDPHQGRLVSTWLDPNLFGAFLLIVLPYFLPLTKGEIKRGWERVIGYLPVRQAGGLLVPALASLALLLTKSRSSLLALLLAGMIFSPLFVHYLVKRYRSAGVVALTAIVGLLITTGLVAAFFLGDRARGLLTVDITAQLRLESLQAALPLAGEHLFTGVGYNRYQFAARTAGLSPNFSLHSRAGADNSLLTLLITTGPPGLFLFLLPWVVISQQLMQKQAFPTLFSLLALFIHSQFVNSLLYSHLLITLIVVVSLALADRPPGYRLPACPAGRRVTGP